MILIVVGALVVYFYMKWSLERHNIDSHPEKAFAILKNEQDNEKGIVYLTQLSNGVDVHIKVIDTTIKDGKHGFHIHEPSRSNKKTKCDCLGDHWKLSGETHGTPIKGHIGDLGNVIAKGGLINQKIYAPRLTIPNIIGKGIVLHSNEDDLGLGGDAESLKTGNSGNRIMCGLIQKI